MNALITYLSHIYKQVTPDCIKGHIHRNVNEVNMTELNEKCLFFTAQDTWEGYNIDQTVSSTIDDLVMLSLEQRFAVTDATCLNAMHLSEYKSWMVNKKCKIILNLH